jgi:hypothetical protein
MWTHRLAMTLVSMASMAVLAQAPPPMPPEPQAAPASVQQPNAPTGSAAALTEDPAMEEAVRMIPRVAKRRETVIDGLENAAEAFCMLLQGGNFGKMLVRVGAD